MGPVLLGDSVRIEILGVLVVRGIIEVDI